MALLKFKKKRNSRSGKFSFTIKNAIVFSRFRNRYFLRIPTEILRVLTLRIGSRVVLRVDGKALVIERKKHTGPLKRRTKSQAR